MPALPHARLPTSDQKTACTPARSSSPRGARPSNKMPDIFPDILSDIFSTSLSSRAALPQKQKAQTLVDIFADISQAIAQRKAPSGERPQNCARLISSRIQPEALFGHRASFRIGFHFPRPPARCRKSVSPGLHHHQAQCAQCLHDFRRGPASDDLENGIRRARREGPVVQIHLVQDRKEMLLRKVGLARAKSGNAVLLTPPGPLGPQPLRHRRVRRTLHHPHRLAFRQCSQPLSEGRINDESDTAGKVLVHENRRPPTPRANRSSLLPNSCVRRKRRLARAFRPGGTRRLRRKSVKPGLHHLQTQCLQRGADLRYARIVNWLLSSPS